MYLDKSADNEKNMHYIKLPNGAIIKLTQIAGFLPRMITSSDGVPEKVRAGDYLGMIKFGSRVDLLLPISAPNGENLYMKLKNGDTVSIGEFLGLYTR
jgi:phosphatidylserine decarboxylase